MSLTEWLLLGILICSGFNAVQNLLQRWTVNKLNEGVSKRHTEYQEWEKEVRREELKTLAELAKGSDVLAKAMNEILKEHPELRKGEPDSIRQQQE